MEDGGTTAVGAWTSLPLDIILEIFRRLESTAVIRCASTCKPWRRAIIGNARFLRPRLDRFVPSLLLGVFYHPDDRNNQQVYLRRTPGPFQSALPSISAASRGSRIQSLIPAGAGLERKMYTELLSSRDGFILLRGRRCWGGLCLLWNTMTGDCKILPDATIRRCAYVLLTGYDDLSVSGTGNADDQQAAVRILAVARTEKDTETETMCTKENRITYQVFSFASGGSDDAGAWEPVKRSVDLEMDTGLLVPVHNPSAVVCGNAVYWIAGPKCHHQIFPIRSTVALDVATGRAWTTDLPEEAHAWYYGGARGTPTLLATSGDGRLSLVRSFRGSFRDHQIKVWVLVDDGQWNLQKTIDVQVVTKQLPYYRQDVFNYTSVLLNAFCPRTGCVIGRLHDQEIRIDLEGSSHPCVEWIGTRELFWYCNYTYEMDWLTYISKMKQF